MRTLLAALAAFTLLAPTANAAAPVPDFSVSPDPPVAGAAAFFTDTSTDPDGGAITRVRWDFQNDGTWDVTQTDFTAPVEHSYPSAGTWSLRMEVADDSPPVGQTAEEVFLVDVAVPNAAPVADFTHVPLAPVAGQQIFFASSSHDRDGTIASYAWEIDGTPAGTDATLATALAEGSHSVKLTVQDGQGGTDDETKTVTVGPAPPPRANQLPVAQFAIAPLQPLIDQLVTFESFSYDPDGPAPALAWDLDGDGFDDGTGSTASTTFTTSGPKAVSLQATDSAGGFNTATRTFTIAPPVATPTTPAQPSLMSPFPVIRLAGTVRPRGARISALEVRAPRGATVTVRCVGKRCPFARQQKTAGTRLVRFPSIRAFLPAGTVITIGVTKENLIGKHTRFLIRADRGPKRSDSCTFPGKARPAPCPDS